MSAWIPDKRSEIILSPKKAAQKWAVFLLAKEAHMDVTQVPIDKIKPYQNNPRWNDAAAQYVAKSIQEFGFLVPLVIDQNYTVVTGHTRLAAAKSLGMNCLVLLPKILPMIR